MDGSLRHGSEFHAETPSKPIFFLLQVSGARSRLEAAETRVGSGERWRHEAELEMVRASRSRRRLGDDGDEDWERGGASGFDGQQRIRVELEALRTNRRRMMLEEDEEVEEETKMSERDRIQGGQTGFNSTEEPEKLN